MSAGSTGLVVDLVRVARELPDATVERLATILDGAPVLTDAVESALLAVVVHAASKDRVREVIAHLRNPHRSAIPPIALAWALRGASGCDAWHRVHERIDLVWTGPPTLSQGIFRTHQTLLDLIAGAERSLIVMTFAAYNVDSVRRALRAAVARGVDVVLIVETDDGPGGKIDVGPLRQLMNDLDRIRVFEWPVDSRPHIGDRYGTLHAKCALADSQVLFVTSANLTGHALELNMELGVLLRGGRAPAQAAGHFAELIRTGVLRPFGPRDTAG